MVFGRTATDSGADDILRLFRLSSSACRVLIGAEDGSKGRLGFGFFAQGSKREMASVTGTLLAVVWLNSSRRREIWLSGRSASRSKTRSTEDRDRWCDLVGIVGGCSDCICSFGVIKSVDELQVGCCL